MRVLFLIVAFLGAAGAGAQAPEHELKAAFLFKFLSFVEWPQAPRPTDTPLVIGVLGADEIAAQLELIVPGRSAQGREVTVRRMREGESAAGLHMLFIGREALRARAGDAKPPASALLTVCDWPGALDQGCVINFVRTGERIGFDVALDTAERRGLRISSRMLAVAQNVRTVR